MSQVMKALQKSERESLHQMSSSMYSGVTPSSYAENRKTSAFGVIAVIVLPPLAVLGAVFRGQVIPSYFDVNTESVVTHQVAMQASPVKVEGSIRLAPELPVLKPIERRDNYANVQVPSLSTSRTQASSLSSSAPLPALSSADHVKAKAKTKAQEQAKEQTQPEPVDSLGLDNLDMSEFSPELVLTIESILNGSNLKADGSTESDLNRVNSAHNDSSNKANAEVLDIEGHLSDFKGQLPNLIFKLICIRAVN